MVALKLGSRCNICNFKVNLSNTTTIFNCPKKIVYIVHDTSTSRISQRVVGNVLTIYSCYENFPKFYQ